MEHYFELPVTYKNEALLFNGRLVTFAYDYTFYVKVNGREVIFERDDAGNLRAITPMAETVPATETELIAHIGEVLKHIQAVRQ
ncbi:hypothetical protein [Niabella sp.]|uniref:hypothetical protein n=1 Tax=Niabella sp. TaxID=1962976 RepID=UPI002614B21A|nr:hypothetical protein [Niabella sp.]